jgi:hypothetical protein
MVRRRGQTGKKRTDKGRGCREKKGTFEEEVQHRDKEGSEKDRQPHKERRNS